LGSTNKSESPEVDWDKIKPEDKTLAHQVTAPSDQQAYGNKGCFLHECSRRLACRGCHQVVAAHYVGLPADSFCYNLANRCMSVLVNAKLVTNQTMSSSISSPPVVVQ